MKCLFCGGSAHPSTGHQYTERVISCGPCYRQFLVWYKARLHNPVAEAATREPGTIIEGPWTEEDQAKREKARVRRRRR